MSRPALGGGNAPSAPAERRLPGVQLVLRRSWWVLVGGAVGLVAGGGLNLVQESTYESTGYLTVVAVGDTDPTSVSRAAQALARLGAAPGVIGPSLTEAGLPEAAANTRLFVRVQAAPDASIISVTGSGPTAAAARNVATTVTDTLLELPAYADFDTRLVASPELPPSSTAPRWLPPVGLAGTGAAVGLVLAATVAQGRRDDAEASGAGSPAES